MTTIPNNNNETVYTSRISEYAKLRLEQIFNEYMFEANNEMTRFAIKQKIENILEEIKTQYLIENKSVRDGDESIHITKLGPIKVYVDTEPDPTECSVIFNRPAQLLWDDAMKN